MERAQSPWVRRWRPLRRSAPCTLQLTTLPKKLSGLTAAVLGSQSGKDFLARAEAWASKFESIFFFRTRTHGRQIDVKGADTKRLNELDRDEIGEERRSPIRELMRELLDTGAPIDCAANQSHRLSRPRKGIGLSRRSSCSPLSNPFAIGGRTCGAGNSS
eukprot:scaffold1282_cov105-Isochrysis_galbana.AAC.4